MARVRRSIGEHLELRGRTICYRRALPRSLREVAGQREYIRSLHTRDLGEAEEMGNVLTRALDIAWRDAARRIESGRLDGAGSFREVVRLAHEEVDDCRERTDFPFDGISVPSRPLVENQGTFWPTIELSKIIREVALEAGASSSGTGFALNLPRGTGTRCRTLARAPSVGPARSLPSPWPVARCSISLCVSG